MCKKFFLWQELAISTISLCKLIISGCLILCQRLLDGIFTIIWSTCNTQEDILQGHSRQLPSHWYIFCSNVLRFPQATPSMVPFNRTLLLIEQRYFCIKHLCTEPHSHPQRHVKYWIIRFPFHMLIFSWLKNLAVCPRVFSFSGQSCCHTRSTASSFILPTQSSMSWHLPCLPCLLALVRHESNLYLTSSPSPINKNTKYG